MTPLPSRIAARLTVRRARLVELLVVAEVHAGPETVVTRIGETRVFALPDILEDLRLDEAERARVSLDAAYARSLGQIRALPPSLRRLAEEAGLAACDARALGVLLGIAAGASS